MEQKKPKLTFKTLGELQSHIESWANEKLKTIREQSQLEHVKHTVRFPKESEFPVDVTSDFALVLRTHAGSYVDIHNQPTDPVTILALHMASTPTVDGKKPSLSLRVSYQYQGCAPVAKTKPNKVKVKDPLKPKVPDLKVLGGFVLVHNEQQLHQWIRRRILGALFTVNAVPRENQGKLIQSPAYQAALQKPIQFIGRCPQLYPVLISKHMQFGYFGKQPDELVIAANLESRLHERQVDEARLMRHSEDWFVGDIYYSSPKTVLQVLSPKQETKPEVPPKPKANKPKPKRATLPEIKAEVPAKTPVVPMMDEALPFVEAALPQ